jgi:hypothetical protein
MPYSTVSWSNPANAETNNDIYATATGDLVTTYYLKATNFGFSIPSTAIIRGITVNVERKASAVDLVHNTIVKIVKSNNIGLTTKYDYEYWPTSDGTVTYGSNTDIWGENWTPAVINQSDFGIAFATFIGSSGTAYVDYFSVTVYYEFPPTPVGYSIKISEKGHDYTEGDAHLVYNSDYPTLKVFASGSWSIFSNEYGGTTQITHNLGYKPMYFVYGQTYDPWSYTINEYYLLYPISWYGGLQTYNVFGAEINENTLDIWAGLNGYGPPGSFTLTGFYIIFYDPGV